jgi:hypothetical protein
MENAALLAELRALANNAPDLEAYKPTSQVHHQWFGKLYALMAQWDPSQAGNVLPWTDPYDVFKTLRDLLASATQSVFIVDPYLDETVFDGYLTSVSRQVSVRLLTRKYTAASNRR